MKIEINGFEIVRILNNNGNIIEAEKLIDINIRNWNHYCSLEALLYQCVRRYDYEQGKYYNYYPYRKRFVELYCSTSFIIDLDKDMGVLKTIKANRESD